MKEYLHKINYYETDQMGVVHHSNYIRFMEEARVDYMEQIGVSYANLEEIGYLSPVLTAVCDYKSMSRFGETLRITTYLEEFKAARFTICYAMYDEQSGELRAKGMTKHCFINKEGNLISLKKEKPEVYQKFVEQL